MKIKNILSVSVLGAFSLGCVSFLSSCDGGSGGGVSGTDATEVESIDLPDNPDQANLEKTGSDATNSGANETLEATYGDQVYDGINAERISAGKSILIRDSQMDSLAAAHNAYLIGQANPGGVIDVNHDNAQARANANAARGFTKYGENTGGIRGYATSVVASTFVEGWVNSPGHFQNIIGDFTHTGVAVSVDTRDGTIYSTQIFAK